MRHHSESFTDLPELFKVGDFFDFEKIEEPNWFLIELFKPAVDTLSSEV